MEIKVGNFKTSQESLPPILREGMEGIVDPKAQLLYLYSASTVLSGLCLNTTGVYHEKVVYPNLYTLVLAPAGSGKGAMTDALSIVKKIEADVRAETVRRLQEYRLARRNGTDGALNGLKPAMKAVVIAGNTSGAMLLKQVYDNGEDTPSIIFETEIDVLTNASKSEWGNLSAPLRQGFHNEPMRVARIGDGGQIHIEKPKLALCLSGTHDQFFRLIPSAEDGLFSRFMIVSFDGGREWQDVQPCDACVNRSEVLRRVAESGASFFQFCMQKGRTVNLTSSRWATLNHFGATNLEVSVTENLGADANVKRHGLMAFKLAMTFSMLRAWESGNQGTELICTDHDFDLAFALMAESYQNSLELLDQLRPHETYLSTSQNAFYSLLPDSFTTKDAIETGVKCRKGKRAVHGYLEKLQQEGKIERLSHGHYNKVSVLGDSPVS